MKSPFKDCGGYWMAEMPLPTDDTPDTVMTLLIKIQPVDDSSSSISTISLLLEHGFTGRLQVKHLGDGTVKNHLAAEILRGVAEEVVISRLRPVRRGT